jgi:type VI secretion system secreted protein Hcp
VLTRASERTIIMAISAYMWLQDADGLYLDSESQVDFSGNAQSSALAFPPNNNIFEVESYSVDVAQVLNIGSQSSGAGAGKVSFDPLIITRKTDRASPILLEMACSGTPFQFVVLALCKSAGGPAPATVFQKFTFKLVAIKSIAWAYDAEEPKDVVTFEYGGLVIEYWVQAADGSMGAKVLGGWNRVKNISDHDPASALI